MGTTGFTYANVNRGTQVKQAHYRKAKRTQLNHK